MPPKPVPWRGYDHVPLPAHDGDSHRDPQFCFSIFQTHGDTFLGSWFWKSGNFLILGFLPLNKKFELFTRQSLQEVDHACGDTFPLPQCSSRKSYLFSGGRLGTASLAPGWSFFSWQSLCQAKQSVIFQFSFTQVHGINATWGFDRNLTPELPGSFSQMSWSPLPLPSSRKAKLFGWNLLCATVTR